MSKGKELTLKELGEWLREEEASIHISSRGGRGKGKTFFVVIVKEVEHQSSNIAGDDLERAVKIAMADF